MKNTSSVTGNRVLSLRFQRREISATVVTGRVYNLLATASKIFSRIILDRIME
jgi:hypothetical protein